MGPLFVSHGLFIEINQQHVLHFCSSTGKSNGKRPDRHPAGKFLSSSMVPNANAAVDAVYHSDWGRIVATLIGVFGDFELAEEAAQEAFVAAVDQWGNDGVPEFPRAWIVQTAKHKAIDRLRRRTRFTEKLESYADSGLIETVVEPDYETDEIPDDRLRLIFTCCHPALAPEAQVALTLRTLGGLETDEIARAFLVPTAPAAERLGGTVSSPAAIRWGRLVRLLMGSEPPAEATGLLALMLLHDSRRE